MRKNTVSLPALLILLVGCATTVPEEVRRAPAEAPEVSEVRAEPQRYEGVPVRWGGHIVSVTNRPDETCLELVERDLERGGRPIEADRSEGRFLACMPQFLDPSIYEPGRLLTVAGVIDGIETGLVGEFEYQYPRVRLDAHQLWSPLPDPRTWERDPYWRDPFWDPYWYGPWRYGPPYYRGPGAWRW